MGDGAGTIGADKITGRLRQRRRRRGQADALQAFLGQLREAFQADGQIGAAFVRRQRVNLIDDDPAQIGEQWLQRRLRQQDGETFRRRQQHVRRVVEQAAAFLRGGIAGADGEARHGHGLRQQRRDFVETLLQDCDIRR